MPVEEPSTASQADIVSVPQESSILSTRSQRFRDFIGTFHEAFSDRAQGSMLDLQECNGPRLQGQLDGEHFSPKASPLKCKIEPVSPPALAPPVFCFGRSASTDCRSRRAHRVGDREKLNNGRTYDEGMPDGVLISEPIPQMEYHAA